MLRNHGVSIHGSWFIADSACRLEDGRVRKVRGSFRLGDGKVYVKRRESVGWECP